MLVNAVATNDVGQTLLVQVDDKEQVLLVINGVHKFTIQKNMLLEMLERSEKQIMKDFTEK